MALTDSAIRSAKPTDKPRKMADEKGLFLLVTPNGGKWWRLKYRFGGKEKLLSLGVYPDVGLKDARERRDEARKLLADGIDPSEHRKAQERQKKQSAENSFEAVAREWLENIRHKWTPRHYADTLKRLETYIFPELGARPVVEVDAAELLAALRKVEKKGADETARKVYRACGQVFRYAIATARCKSNPAADLRGALRAKAKVEHRAAVTITELPDLLRKIEVYDSEGGGDLQTRLALELLAFTFVRTGELREAEWGEFDLDRAEWRIPAERMKMKEAHFVPLSRQAVDVLRQLKEINGGYRFVFPGRNPSRPMSKNTALFALYRMGYHSRMTGHGFRAVASTALNEMGFKPDVIERQLAHAERNKVRAAYHRSEYLAERRKMMQAWADYLDGLQAGAEVIPLHGKTAA